MSDTVFPMPHPVLITPRLRLRCLTPADFAAFAEMNADPRVMELLPKILSRAESDAVATRMIEQFERHGFGKWAVAVTGGADFIGYVGLAPVDFDASFAPAVEIGWRLARAHWGCGYATEAARAVLEFAFTTLKLEKIVSFTVPANKRSIRVMERLGLKRDLRGDFDHPKLPPGHSLRRHTLYIVTQSDWENR